MISLIFAIIDNSSILLINTNTNFQEPSIGMAINMEVDTLRGWSMSSNFRATLIYSNMSSIICVEHV